MILESTFGCNIEAEMEDSCETKIDDYFYFIAIKIIIIRILVNYI